MEELTTLRRCGRCHEQKPLCEFNPKKKGGNGKWQGYCKPCHAEWKREYYKIHRDEYIHRAMKHRELLKEHYHAAKQRPCQDCGQNYPHYVMDFDHREGEDKLFNVADLNMHRWLTVKGLLEEIAKCDLVCANCHRERTHQRHRNKKLSKQE